MYGRPPVEKAKKVKLVCPQAAACYQSIQNKLHERRQELGGAATRTQFFTALWDRIDEAVEHVADGFKNLRQLSRFVGSDKRQKAEERSAEAVGGGEPLKLGWGAWEEVGDTCEEASAESCDHHMHGEDGSSISTSDAICQCEPAEGQGDGGGGH